ncbi:MAG: sensor histidine kinase [Armatimonadetes bacterium]|nr:sensor histidine kinase [Armatimonadota bacterium]
MSRAAGGLIALARTVREAMLRSAVRTTGAHLARHRSRITEDWIRRLYSLSPRYAEHEAYAVRWAGGTLDLLLAVLSAADEASRREIRDRVGEHSRAVAARQVEMGFSLEEILQALTLMSASVSAEVQLMLNRRLWVAYPPDVMRATDLIYEAMDLQELAISQSYLAERDRRIQESARALEETNQQLRTLLQEMHHRIKNNLQTLADLLYLEKLSAEPGAGKSLQDSIGRVKSIAAVHQLLSVDHIEDVDVHRLALRVGEMIGTDLAGGGRGVTVDVQGNTLLLSSKQATAIALVLSELVTNALEHAFSQQVGRVTIALREEGDEVIVSVCDNGKGLPARFSFDHDAHLGLLIVRDLVSRDLQGTFSLRSGAGTTAEVRFRR